MPATGATRSASRVRQQTLLNLGTGYSVPRSLWPAVAALADDQLPILTKGIGVLTERYHQSEGKLSPSERSDANAVQGGASFRLLVGPTGTWKRKSSGRFWPR